MVWTVRKGKTVSSTRGNNIHAHFKQVKPPASHSVRLEYSPNVGTQNDVLMLSTDLIRSHSNLENNPIWKKEAEIAYTIQKARSIFQDRTQTYPVFDWEGSFIVMDSSSGP